MTEAESTHFEVLLPTLGKAAERPAQDGVRQALAASSSVHPAQGISVLRVGCTC